MSLTQPLVTPQQAITLVILNASINQMSSGIAEAESFQLPEAATALKLARDYLMKDRDRLMALWSRAVQVATTMPTNGVVRP